jgi:gluconokinase
MKVPGLRSPHEMVGGIVHFGRMLDKIRLHAQGKLPADYHKNLGTGFDGRCCSLLGVKYEDVVARVKLGGEDEDILEGCHTNGRKPSEEEIEIFNSYLRKRGWRDDASTRLAERKKEYGITDRHDVQTFFDIIDVDEGHEVRTKF